MRFICGVVRDGQRRILSAESAPTLENIDELASGVPDALAASASFDWGPEAGPTAAWRTAYVILRCVTDEAEAERLATEYAELVRDNMTTERMWILPLEEVETWVSSRRTVM